MSITERADRLRSLSPAEYAAVPVPTPAEWRAARERQCADLRQAVR